MTVKGTRIFLGPNLLAPSPLELIKDIPNGETFYWGLFYLYATGDLKDGRSIPDFENEINNSVNGISIQWQELKVLLSQFYQIIDLTLIGSRDPNFLKRYETEQEMFESCDIVIELNDGVYWQIFSKDDKLIENLASKYTKTERLDSDFPKSKKNN